MNENVNINFVEDSEDLQQEILRIANKLRDKELEECCSLINEYLKATINPRDFNEKDSAFSTSYAALVCKKANSYGFINAFIQILGELGIFSTLEERHFNYNDQAYTFAYLHVNTKDGTLKISPYTEKLCHKKLLNHDIWFSNYTWGD